MKLPFFIAKRYLFSKKSTNAINIITGISVGGLAIGTASLIIVLSVFNGFAGLLTALCSYFNPDLKISPTVGKTFVHDTVLVEKIKKIEGVKVLSLTLDEIAFFDYQGNQDFGRIKGVDNAFDEVTSIDTTLREGVYRLMSNGKPYAVVGAGIRNTLGIDVENPFLPLEVYVPRQDNQGLPEQQFRKRNIYPAGTFAIQQEFDNSYILSDLAFAQEVMGLEGQLSAIEIKLTDANQNASVKQQLHLLLGNEFKIQDKFEQNASFLRLMNIEKWISFAILSLMLLLIAFNLIGALWMIVLDKQGDIAILKSMGMENKSIRQIFLFEGVILSGLGFVIGLFLAILLYVLQKEVGLVSIPSGFVVDAYPIEMNIMDVAAVALIVFFIGFIASLIPSGRATRVKPIFRED